MLVHMSFFFYYNPICASSVVNVSTPSPSQAAEACLAKRWTLVCVSSGLSFSLSPITEKRAHVPAHGALLFAAGNHLKREGSAVPPAGHPLGPVSIAPRRGEVFLQLFCSWKGEC